MSAEGKVVPLVDETGAKLPQNAAEQFRNVQSGLEHLKGDAEVIIAQLKSVGHKLSEHTTDLSVITAKVNSIEEGQAKHMDITLSLINEVKSIGMVVNTLGNSIEEIQKTVTLIRDDLSKTE